MPVLGVLMWRGKALPTAERINKPGIVACASSSKVEQPIGSMVGDREGPWLYPGPPAANRAAPRTAPRARVLAPGGETAAVRWFFRSAGSL